MNKRWRNIGLTALLVLAIVVIAPAFLGGGNTQQEARTMRYSDFVEAVEDNQISRVLISPDRNTAQVVENDGRRAQVNLAPDKELLGLLTQHDVDIAVQPTRQAPAWQSAVGSLIFPLLLLGGLFFLFRRAQGGGGGNPAMQFGKSKARVQMEPSTQVTFSDVAGISGAKLELTEVVDFLKNPDRFTAVGAKIPKGVLLVGPPGTGKTLLAKAVAGEAGVPFFSISGSEFVEMFVGVGASRVRDLFEQAKKNAPCIIFIDEIDAVGRQRGAGLGGGNDEREQTLNQLLVEMDGFAPNEGIIVIAATNRPDVLDPALMRPGRFDRHVVVPTPDLRGRESILKVHTKQIPLSSDTDLQSIARGTPGFTGADLANLANEAALWAARNDKPQVDTGDFEYAKDKVLMGAERRSLLITDDEKRTTAYHEAGHAIVAAAIPEVDPVHKVTIIPRGRALGLTQLLPSEDHHSYSKKKLVGQLAMIMGGRAAEHLVFNRFTTGASDDLKKATEIARKMVCQWGMSEELGPLTYSEERNAYLGRDMLQHKWFSNASVKMIDTEVRGLLHDSYQKAFSLLETNRQVLDYLADQLIETETIDGNLVRETLKNPPAIN